MVAQVSLASIMATISMVGEEALQWLNTSSAKRLLR